MRAMQGFALPAPPLPREFCLVLRCIHIHVFCLSGDLYARLRSYRKIGRRVTALLPRIACINPKQSLSINHCQNARDYLTNTLSLRPAFLAVFRYPPCLHPPTPPLAGLLCVLLLLLQN